MGARPSQFKAAAVEVEPIKAPRVERQWSPQQQDIFNWFEYEPLSRKYDEGPHGSPHLVVRARAGTGKTTTIIEGVNRAPESSILLCAFNKKIAEELNSRLDNPNAEAKTLHALGFAAIRRNWRGMSVAQGTARQDYLTDQVCGLQTPRQVGRLVSMLHTKARDMMPIEPTIRELRDLCFFFDLTPDDDWSRTKQADGGYYDVDYVVKKAHAAMLYAAANEPRYDIGIDFADMIYLPLVYGLLAPDYDMVVVDEAQDLTLAQLTIAQRVCRGRICVVGDDKQCQPAGTMVRSSVSGNVPIESLKIGDTIESFDRHGQVFIKSGRVLDIAKRDYSGTLITVFAGGRSSRCTPNHKWLVRWTHKNTPAWITYLMRKGDRYRVGQCQLFYNGELFGLSARARTEEADAAWVLRVHSSQQEALAYEQILSARYGLPEMIFKPCSSIKHFTQEVIDLVYTSLNASEQRSKALRCLADHRREETYPIYDKPAPYARRGQTTLFETQACNLIDNFMSVATAPDTITGHDKKDRHAVSWMPLQTGYESFEGPVYSLDIERYHKYVADGLVTCNSIYAFRGADTGSLDRLRAELGASELPLTVTYRCCQAVVRQAQHLVHDIVAHESNPEGIVDDTKYEQMLLSAAPGNFILSRLNAPLVSTTLKLLRGKKRARMAGRDIGAGISSVIKKIGARNRTTVEELLTKLGAWETKQVTRFATYQQLQLIERTRDQADMIRALAEEAEDVADLLNRIDWLFTDDEEAEQILCSSVHKAKGLEADRVYILQETLYLRGPSVEEDNIFYVATTRAKNHLTMVNGLR